MQYYSLRLPEGLREKLREAFGKVLSEKDFKVLRGRNLIAVGDIAAFNLLKSGIRPRVIVVDDKTMRKETGREVKEVLSSYGSGEEFRVENPAGFINKGVWPVIERAIKKGGKIIVDGEEDLLAIPCVLLAPNGWTIVYGLPDKGLAVIEVKEGVKERFNEMLNRFEKWN